MDMLDNFLFSINTMLPIFGVMFAGFLLRRFSFLSEEFMKYGNRLVFYGALPASLFMSTCSLEFETVFDVAFVFFAVGATLASVALIWVVTELLVKDKSVVGTLVQAGYRGNFAILGLPLLANVIGEANMAKAILVLAFVIPVYNVVAVVVLSVRSKNMSKVEPKKLLLNILKNPLIISIAAGFVFSSLHWRLPVAADGFVGFFADLSTPLALLCLGGSIKLRGMDSKLKYSLVMTGVKVAALPVLVVGAAYLLGFRSYELVILMIMGGVPTAVASYPMAVEMGGDGDIAANSVVLSTFVSVLSLTAFIYFFKAMGVF